MFLKWDLHILLWSGNTQIFQEPLYLRTIWKYGKNDNAGKCELCGTQPWKHLDDPNIQFSIFLEGMVQRTGMPKFSAGTSSWHSCICN